MLDLQPRLPFHLSAARVSGQEQTPAFYLRSDVFFTGHDKKTTDGQSGKI